MNRRLTLMLSLTAALTAATCVLNYAVNPYGAWRTAVVDPDYRIVSAEHLVTPYLVRTASPHTVLLGTSRVLFGMRIEQGERDGVMNAAMKGASIAQLARIAQVAMENPSLHRIVWGADFFTFGNAWNRDDSRFERRIDSNPIEVLEDTLLSGSAALASLDEVRRAIRGRSALKPSAVATIPWPMALSCADFEHTRSRGLATSDDAEIIRELAYDLPDYSSFQMRADAVEIFRRTIEAARARGIEVVVFVPPMSEFELELIRQSGRWPAMQAWKRTLAAITPFTDFSRYNEAARTDALFMHVMHFKTGAGFTILRSMLGMPIDRCSELVATLDHAGTRVDSGNIDQVIAAQDRSAAAQSRDSRYVRLAAKANALRATRTDRRSDH